MTLDLYPAADPPTPLSPIALAIQQCIVKNPMSFNYIHDDHYGTRKMFSAVSSIETYSKIMGIAHRCLMVNALVPPLTYRFNVEEIYLSDFFIDVRGYYVDEGDAASEFFTTASSLLKLYEVHEQSINKDPVVERNLALLD